MDASPVRVAAGALLLLALAAGCRYLDTDSSLLVTIPEPPPAWSAAFGPMRNLVIWIDENGRPARSRLDPGVDKLVVRTGKGGWNPVAAFALPGSAAEEPAVLGGTDGLLLYPSGAVTPGGGESVQLSYQAGAAALILLRLAAAGVPIEAINVPRLLRELSERTGGDPWRADIDRLVLRLAEKDFRADLIRIRDETRAVLPGDPTATPGFLVSRDALRPLVVVAPGENGAPAVWAPLSALSRFYSPDGTMRLDLWISPDGGAQWISAPQGP